MSKYGCCKISIMCLGDVTTHLATVLGSIHRGDVSPTFHSEGAENTTISTSCSPLTPCQQVSHFLATTPPLRSLLTQRRNLISIILH